LNDFFFVASINATMSTATPFAPLPPDAAGAPLYRQAKQALLAAIESGRYPAASALPNEAALAAALGVSIGTLRHAVDELVAERIVVRRQGRGTFVATHTTERFVFQFFHVERSDGARDAPSVELLSFERGRLDDEAATALSRRAGDAAIVIENRLSLQGRPVVYDCITLPAALFRGLTEKRLRERSSTIYHLYQTEYGITVLRATERVRAVAADRTTARVLGVAPAGAVLQVRRTALTFNDKPVEYRVSTVSTALHDYVSTLAPQA
jgi:GntR family transcriptional regulator